MPIGPKFYLGVFTDKLESFTREEIFQHLRDARDAKIAKIDAEKKKQKQPPLTAEEKTLMSLSIKDYDELRPKDKTKSKKGSSVSTKFGTWNHALGQAGIPTFKKNL